LSRRVAPRSSALTILGVAAVCLGVASGGALSAAADRSREAQHPAPPASTPGTTHQHGGEGHHHSDNDHPHDDIADHAQGHTHAPVPPEYKSAHVPASAWTNPRLIARGRQIYADRCAVCHGDSGDGKGPAGVALPLKPPDLRDRKMVGEMAGNYWFWRVTEGGLVEPFKSGGSMMPAWKDELSVEDRWAVIVYQHTFSGHEGPHVTSEHPEIVVPSPAGRGTAPSPAAAAPPGGSPSSQSPGGRRH
jgi:mono/diheme cytochrome c family protein